MANDKDFVVNGPVVVGKDTKVTVGTIASGAVDLSTGNYFTDSPSGDYTYTFANPGAVQSFQIEATGGSLAVAETFSTTLYTGTGGALTVNNGIDLSGEGGLVWQKLRNQAKNHNLFDTVSGVNKYLSSNQTTEQLTDANINFAFNANGFSMNNSYSTLNALNDQGVSWTFRKASKFFDVVTYTGDGDSTGRTISHSLGSVPGMILIKKTSGAADWIVYHRSEGATKYLELNNTSTSSTYNMFNDTDPTSTEFSVSSYSKVNNNGDTYVAYLFAHDTASDGLIKCGSFVNDSSSVNVEVNLGWKPQWLLIKGASSGSGLGHWYIYDNSRTGQVLSANQSAAEGADTSFTLTNNGFTPTANFNGTLIYMAIRSPSAPAITWPSSIEWTAGSTPSTPAEGETDVYTFTTDDGGTTYTGIQSIDNAS